MLFGFFIHLFKFKFKFLKEIEEENEEEEEAEPGSLQADRQTDRARSIINTHTHINVHTFEWIHTNIRIHEYTNTRIHECIPVLHLLLAVVMTVIRISVVVERILLLFCFFSISQHCTPLLMPSSICFIRRDRERHYFFERRLRFRAHHDWWWKWWCQSFPFRL
mgnify:CR=1 FL=1